MSCDSATTLQPGRQSETLSQKNIYIFEEGEYIYIYPPQILINYKGK